MRHEFLVRRLWTFVLTLALLGEAGCLHENREPLAAIVDEAFDGITRTGISINPRPGVSVDMVLLTPRQPVVALLLLPGGPGLAEISGINIGNRRDFVTVTAEAFAARGIAVAVVDAASDHADGLSPNYRQTAAHLNEIDAVITRVKQATGLPVWMLGISRSTLSVAHIAVNTDVGIDGIVLLSSVTNIPPEAQTINVVDVGLDRVGVPALVVAHENDGCQGTPPGGADQIVARLINSPNAVAELFSGGFTEGGNPCTPGSHHTFNGIQNQVVAAIAGFIKANIHTD